MLFLDIEQLGEQLASLTLAEAQELSRYIEESDGLGPTGLLVGVGPGSDEGGAEQFQSQGEGRV